MTLPAVQLREPAARASGYRPWLDGLRAVAILLVLVEHSWGGYGHDVGGVGVGLFFALSGYLITGLLLDEHDRTGAISLRAFYRRRAARLLPALVLVVAGCDLGFALAGRLDAVRASLGTLTFTADYLTIAGGSWLPGWGQTWTLAVEEHFYLLWPVALLGLHRRLGLRGCLYATLGLCALALIDRCVVAYGLHGSPLWLEVGSVERADGLLSGCAAALAVRLGWRPGSWTLAASTAVLAALLWWGQTSSTPVRVGGAAVLAVAASAVVAALDTGASGRVRRPLSARPVVRLGVLSYGVYLWHYPLIALAPLAGLPDTQLVKVAVAVASVGVAELSYRFVEAPARRWARGRTRSRAEHRASKVTQAGGARCQ